MNIETLSRKSLEKGLAKRCRRSRVLAGNQLAVDDNLGLFNMTQDISLLLHSKVGKEYTYSPRFSRLVLATQFLNLSLKEEGDILYAQKSK